jgi:hypothetical protein
MHVESSFTNTSRVRFQQQLHEHSVVLAKAHQRPFEGVDEALQVGESSLEEQKQKSRRALF